MSSQSAYNFAEDARQFAPGPGQKGREEYFAYMTKVYGEAAARVFPEDGPRKVQKTTSTNTSQKTTPK